MNGFTKRNENRAWSKVTQKIAIPAEKGNFRKKFVPHGTHGLALQEVGARELG